MNSLNTPTCLHLFGIISNICHCCKTFEDSEFHLLDNSISNYTCTSMATGYQGFIRLSPCLRNQYIDGNGFSDISFPEIASHKHLHNELVSLYKPQNFSDQIDNVPVFRVSNNSFMNIQNSTSIIGVHTCYACIKKCTVELNNLTRLHSHAGLAMVDVYGCDTFVFRSNQFTENMLNGGLVHISGGIRLDMLGLTLVNNTCGYEEPYSPLFV